MSKAVLMSIQPKWCELIANSKKTVEVRKTQPKLETPFKVYIYCTKGSPYLNRHNNRFYLELKDTLGGKGCGLYTRLSGKVIGEFVCVYVEDFKEFEYGFDALHRHIKLNACMSYGEIYDYLGFEKCGYGWHISDLVIYDKPKELSEFSIIDNEAVKQCEHRKRVYNNPDYTNGAWLPGSYVCNKHETDWCTKCRTKLITRPPQSWCYVEEVTA